MKKGLFRRREPFQFMLVLGMGGSILIFAFVLFVLLIRRHSGDVHIFLPKIFWFSTLLLLFSSLTLSWANRAFVEERFRTYRLNICLTLLAGIVFIVLQFIGWRQMFMQGISFDTFHMGGVFIYVLTGLHVVHTLAGLIALMIANRDAFGNMQYVDFYVYSVNPPNQLKIKLISIYWHFVDGLWTAVFLFLLLFL